MKKITDYKYLVGIDFGDGETTASLITVMGDGELSEPHKLRIVKDTAITDKKVESAVVKYPNEDYYRLSRADYDTIYDSYEDNFKLRPDKFFLPQYERKKTAFINFIETVFKRIIEENNSEPKLEYNESTGEKNFYLCIACPSRWEEDRRENGIDYIGKYKALMHEHNIPVDSIIKESDAAFFYFHKNQILPNDNNVLIIDYGSSTIDFTYCNKQGRKFIDCGGSKATNLGAQKVEQAVLDYIIQDEPVFARSLDIISSKRLNPSIHYEKYMKKRLKYAKEKFYSNPNDRFEIQGDLSQLFDYGDKLLFYPPPSTNGNMHIPGGYTAEQFENMISSYKEKVEYQLETIYNKKYFFDRDKGPWIPDYIIITGGASKMGWFKEKVHKVFSKEGEDITVIVDQHDPSYIVSHGIVKFLSAYYQFVKQFQLCRKQFKKSIDVDRDIAIASGEAITPYYARELCKVCDVYSSSTNRSSLNDLVQMLDSGVLAQLGQLLSGSELYNLNQEMMSYINIKYKRIIQDVCKDIYTKAFDISFDIDLNFPGYQFWSNNMGINGSSRNRVETQIGPYVRICFLDSINWGKTRSDTKRKEIARRLKDYYNNNRLIDEIAPSTVPIIRKGINDRIDLWLDSIEHSLPIDLYL